MQRRPSFCPQAIARACNRRLLTRMLILFAAVASLARCEAKSPATQRPNILLAIADDWGWPHAGVYGDPVVKTPAFDRIAREGALFHHAYVASPSCTPSRNAILTGKWHWRLGAGANLWSIFPDRHTTYPEMLRAAGYEVGYRRKAFGPGRTETPGRELVSKQYKGLVEFLNARTASKPFCFWLGSHDPHRSYDPGSGARSGMDLSRIQLPACFPDSEVVRSDVADYYWEVQRFDRLVGDAIKQLEQQGELDNTIVIVTGDHGMPFPRCKSHLYDTGTRVPLAIRWPEGSVRAGTVIEEFVSLTDLAPSLLTAASLDPEKHSTLTDGMNGRSLWPLLNATAAEGEPADRTFVLFGKERHVPAQEAPDSGGYPCRGLRTHDFLFIQNYTPNRWPSGTPNYKRAFIPGVWFGDTDNGPTKSYMIDNRERDADHRRFYNLAFAKRPAEELYDLRTDRNQLTNVADQPNYEEIKKTLAKKLQAALRDAGDPRTLGQDPFTNEPYLGRGPRHPDWKSQPQ